MSIFSHPGSHVVAAGLNRFFPGECARKVSAISRSFPAPRRSAFWLAVWLAVALVFAKAIHLGAPAAFTWSDISGYQRTLAIAAHQDILFAAIVGLVAQGLLMLTARWRKIQTLVWVHLVLFSALCAFFGIFSVFVFNFVGTPLTWSLVAIAGGFGDMSSSVGHFATPGNILLTLAAPIGFVVLLLLSPRIFRARQNQWTVRYLQVPLAVLLLAYIALARQSAARSDWLDRPDRQIASNPHWVLLASMFTDLTTDRAAHLDGPFPKEYLDDFQTAAERHTNSASPSPLAALLSPDVKCPRNVITIVIESCPTQHMSLYGSKYKTTPRLEAEANNAAVFENFYCHQGLTANSLAAITLSIFPRASQKKPLI